MSVLLQVRIDPRLRNEVKKQLDKDGLTWSDLVSACFGAYLDEKSKKDPQQKK
jgi:antitoxin component of RelBE/YafQ-DinJ toxin-antitoxin module